MAFAQLLSKKYCGCSVDTKLKNEEKMQQKILHHGVKSQEWSQLAHFSLFVTTQMPNYDTNGNFQTSRHALFPFLMSQGRNFVFPRAFNQLSILASCICFLVLKETVDREPGLQIQTKLNSPRCLTSTVLRAQFVAKG